MLMAPANMCSILTPRQLSLAAARKPRARRGKGQDVALPATLVLKRLALFPSIISMTLKNDPNNSSSTI